MQYLSCFPQEVPDRGSSCATFFYIAWSDLDSMIAQAVVEGVGKHVKRLLVVGGEFQT
jgi:hypothetical protein